VFLVPLLVAVATSLAAPHVCYRHPVAAPVLEPFQAPACQWCPGNRGLDYGTPPGTQVRAAAAGRVIFSGAVAGARWLTVRHADGLRTSYGPLASIAVRSGRTVAAGDVLGRTGGRLHVGLRRGDAYLDPAAFFGPPLRLQARLVPLTAPPRPRSRPSCPTPGAAAGRSASMLRRSPGHRAPP
jgi:murein DD-endopeptidase MepM/ murein hydrolase activator NlpD